MTSEFSEIFSRFYAKITDYNLVALEDDIVEEMLRSWLKYAISISYVRRIFDEFVVDEDLGEIEYTLKVTTTDEEDKDFVEETLAKGMVIGWLDPNLKSVLNTQQVFSGKETNFYSQSAHLNAVQGLYSEARNELRRFVQDRGFMYNSYLQG